MKTCGQNLPAWASVNIKGNHGFAHIAQKQGASAPETGIDFIAHKVYCGKRNEDAVGFSLSLKARGHVDAMAHQVAAGFCLDIADMDANPDIRAKSAW